MRRTVWLAALLLCATGVIAADKDTRAGSCDDAKKQMDYFCKANPNDTMVSIGTACNNAKKNMAAACEGKVEADPQYKFDEHGKVKPN